MQGSNARGGMLAALSMALVLCAGAASAQTAKDLVGSYTLVSIALEKDGKTVNLFGDGPKGSLTLDASGRFSIIIVRGDLPKFASSNREAGTADENKAIVHGSIGYFGTYTVNAADKSINLRTEGSTFPNWVGTEQKRLFTLTGDEFKYANPTTTVGAGVVHVVWKRAK
jgi:hypothetical protein